MTQAGKAQVVVVGGGPAGLMAAEAALAAGVRVALYDAMPSVGRKFLLAGKGGMNLTHSEARPAFDARFRGAAGWVGGWLDALDGPALRLWAEQLGVATFVGSSGRVFPKDMKAAPLLRAWLHRLRASGLAVHTRSRWQGVAPGAGGGLTLRFAGQMEPVAAQACVLALGGGSWPQLGSDGSWVPTLVAAGVDVAPLQAANCGVEVRTAAGGAAGGWSGHLAERAMGTALKNVRLTVWQGGQPTFERLGECVLTATGLEGPLIYAASAEIRAALAAEGEARLTLNLLPHMGEAAVRAAVQHPRGSRSMASHVKSRLRTPTVFGLLAHEALPREALAGPDGWFTALTALPLAVTAQRPLAEAISTAGGVRREALDEGLMLTALPGVFCAGEMLDWEAPTGGYLLTASMASGRVAGAAAARWAGR